MGGRLDGRVAVVTGGASGIGRASSLLFAREGAKVVTFDQSAEVEETARLIHQGGGQAIAVTGDAGNEDDVMGLINTAVDAYGTLDAIYANAGISGASIGYRPFFDLEGDDWSLILRVNLIGPFLAIKHAAPIMREKGKGSIICTASVAGLRSGAGPSPYSASKAGVINLVQTACQELTGTGVRVNAICPGLIETGMTKPLFDKTRAAGKEHKLGQLNPLQRAGVPHELAHAALFLASDDASYVNGQAIVVDGGLSSSHPFSPSRSGSGKI
jgi:NAD(P)-dependent dehydrogenase (short-subunit alcohol dehydrogenase family)